MYVRIYVAVYKCAYICIYVMCLITYVIIMYAYIATYIYCIMHLHAYFKLDFSKYIVISSDHYNNCIDISLLVCYVRVWYDFAILWQAHIQTLVFSTYITINCDDLYSTCSNQTIQLCISSNNTFHDQKGTYKWPELYTYIHK